MPGNSDDRICAVILAGGEGSRFGRLKQIEPVGETCLLGIVVSSALHCAEFENVVLVLGAGADMVKGALGGIIDDNRLEVIINDNYTNGMSTSIRAGLEAAQRNEYDAVVFLLGDMPMIDAGLLDAMIARYRSSDRSLCYVRANGRTGHPIIVRKDHFDAFMNIEGDIGGREIVRENIESALEIDIDDEGIDHQLDINNAEDMKAYLSLCRGRNAT